MNNFSLIQTVIKRTSPSCRIAMQLLALFVLVPSMLFVYSGCSGLTYLSDKEAVNMVSEYYLYYGEGEKVGASIVKREEFNDSCKCYPIKFNVYRTRTSSGIKTFYFFKGPSGKFSLKKYANAVKT